MSPRRDFALHAVKAYLKAQLREIRKKQAALLKEDADALHDVRVASRRLRALLSEQGKWFPAGRVDRAHMRLQEIGRGLGRARELDVCLELVKELSKFGIRNSNHYLLRSLEDIRATESSAIQRTANLLATTEFEQTFQNILDVHIGQSPYGAKRPARRMSRRYEMVLDAYEAWRAEPAEEALHRLRIAFKKLRYTCEIYRKCGQREVKSAEGEAPATDSPLETFIDELKVAQDRLGDWHDMVVLQRYLVAIVEDAPECERTGCEAVMARLDKSSQKRLAAFASYARRFFGKARTARTRALLVIR